MTCSMREKSNHQTTKLKSMVKVEEGKVRTWWLEEVLPREGSLSDSGSFSDILFSTGTEERER